MCNFGPLASDLVNLAIARRAGVGLGKVIRVRLALRECATAAEPTGDLSGFDTETWALVLGIHRFMGEAMAVTNLIGNGVATIVISRWERELDAKQLHEALATRPDMSLAAGAHHA